MDEVLEEIKEPEKAKRHVIKYIHQRVLRLNFYRLHMTYFIIVIGISALIVYGEGLANARSEIDGTKLRFIDALFLCTSAMTTTGLNTVNLGSLTAFQQAVFAILLFIGNVVFVSTFTVMIRIYYFRKKLTDVVVNSKAGRKALEDIERQESRTPGNSRPSANNGAGKTNGHVPEHSEDVRKRRKTSTKRRDRSEDSESAGLIDSIHYHQTGFGSLPAPWELKGFQTALRYPFRSFAKTRDQQNNSYMPFEPKFDTRGRFTGLSEHERDELGGVEYRALTTLLWVLAFYQIFWLLLGVIFLVPYSYRTNIRTVIITSQPGGLNPGWWAFFSVLSSFANGGFNLLNANFEPFNANYYILIVVGTLTIAGQTHFPVFLRFIVWTLSKIFPNGSRVQQTFFFLLHHPRRCFIYMFPAKETWYLFAIQLVIDLTAWVLFEILDLGLASVMSIPPGPRVFDGLFQAVGLRTSGSYIITLSELAPAVLVAYLVAMYISSFPIVMALRRTNTYEERSIGLDEGEDGGGLATHLRMQLAYDIWFQILAWFLICIVERTQIMLPQPGFSTFYLLFEVTSAYGTVGLSTGVPNQDYSLSGEFKTLSKIIIIFVMVRGRHRGLPYAIDRSILIPGEGLMHRMDKEYNSRGYVSESEEEELREDQEKSGQTDKSSGQALEGQDPEREEDHNETRDHNHQGHEASTNGV